MVNIKPVQLGKTTRMSFSKINEVLDMPNLIEVQKDSYNWFLNEGLKEVFGDVSSITDYTATWCWSLSITGWTKLRNTRLSSARNGT